MGSGSAHLMPGCVNSLYQNVHEPNAPPGFLLRVSDMSGRRCASGGGITSSLPQCPNEVSCDVPRGGLSLSLCSAETREYVPSCQTRRTLFILLFRGIYRYRQEDDIRANYDNSAELWSKRLSAHEEKGLWWQVWQEVIVDRRPHTGSMKHLFVWRFSRMRSAWLPSLIPQHSMSTLS